jgi:hypothetical protein
MNILIISYYFPPYPKVGSRRWAKFAKYLLRKGHNTFVLCNTNTVDKSSLWDDDINQLESEKRVFRLVHDYKLPYFKTKLPKKTLEKIKWHFSKWLFIQKQKLEKGFLLDNSKPYAREFVDATKKIIKQREIDTIVITGGPFYYCYAIGKLKKNYPTINFILDIRDPWVNLNNNEQTTSKQKTYEAHIEQLTFQSFDVLMTCHTVIMQDWENRYPEMANKFYLLEHAYDIDDFCNLEITNKEPSTKISNQHKTAFIGTLYPFMVKEVEQLIRINDLLAEHDKSFKVDFYSFTKDYEKQLKEANVSYEFKKLLKPGELFAELKQYNSILIMRPKTEDGWEHFFSSKFYELLLLKIAILYIGPTSLLSQFISEHQLGTVVLTDNQNPDLKLSNIIFPQIDTKQIEKLTAKYSFDHITDLLIEKLATTKATY